jgi:hypothetical protein
MTATLDRTVITQPGVYDLPADVYHADPVPPELGGSLSSSGAKLLLPRPAPPSTSGPAPTPPTPTPSTSGTVPMRKCSALGRRS